MVKKENKQLLIRRKKHIKQLVLTLFIIIAINVVSEHLFTRFDLTSDKRYTLSKNTKQIIKNIDDIVYFEIYLDGNLPAGFFRLKKSVNEILDEFRVYGKDFIQYKFIDPSEEQDPKKRETVLKKLYSKGLIPINLQVKEKDGGSSQKIIFPSIMVSYKNKEIPINLLKNNINRLSEESLNTSVQNLEYELTFAIDNLTKKEIKKIAFLQGHGELLPPQVSDLAQSLSVSFQLQWIDMDERPYALTDSNGNNNYELLIVAKPTSTFSEKDKFIIDQFVMNGGKSIWLIDAVNVEMDSLSKGATTLAISRDLNLDDQFFKYGARINPKLIQDVQCMLIPVNTAIAGEAPKFTSAPWLYAPLLLPSDAHSITKNLNLISSEFPSVIDTVGLNKNVKKQFLLASSDRSKTVNTPLQINLGMIAQRVDIQSFRKKFLPVSVLLEGSFSSVYQNRKAPFPVEVKKESKATKMIIIADGDIIRNQVVGIGANQKILPLGYDRYTKQTFGNKEFLLNAINYLCDKQYLLQLRTKEHKLRLLDKTEINFHKLKWQMLNVVLPIVLIVLFGIIFYFFRKRKYTKN